MKTYTLEATSDPSLFRLLDRKGDWRFYFHKPSGLYLKAVNAILDEGYAKGIRFYEYLKKNSQEQIEKLLESRGERGDAIHQAIGNLLSFAGFEPLTKRESIQIKEDNGTTRTLTDEEWLILLSFQTFWNEHQVRLIAFERATYSLKYGYAGTLDFIGRLTKRCGFDRCKCKNIIGKIGLLDWKTSSGIYPNHGAQVSAYEKGENLKEILGKHRIGYTGILRLGTKHSSGFEFQPYDRKETNNHFQEFLAAQKISRASSEGFDPVKEIYDIPEELNLNVIMDKIVKRKKKEAA